MQRLYAILAIAGILNIALVLAQAPKDEFEVASVKRVAQARRGSQSSGGPGTADPERLTRTGVTLTSLLTGAYNLKTSRQLIGPSWMDNEQYDVIAKVAPGTTRQQMRVMMQNLLRKRFQIQLHHETQEFRILELTVAKGGPKLKESPPGAPYPSVQSRTLGTHNQQTFKAYTMPGLAGWLGGQLDALVFDSTNLGGAYDLTLELELTPPPESGPVAQAGIFFGPVVAALKDFGLRLEPAKPRLDVVVIDHAEKEPTEN